MQNLSEYKTYFQTLISQYTPIDYFLYDTTENLIRLLSESRSNITYPAFLLPTPILNPKKYQETNLRLMFEGDFIIVQKAGQDDHIAQDTALEQTSEMCLDIFTRLRKDSRANLFRLENNDFRIEPIEPMGPDYIIGHRVELEISVKRAFCYNEELWTA